MNSYHNHIQLGDIGDVRPPEPQDGFQGELLTSAPVSAFTSAFLLSALGNGVLINPGKKGPFLHAGDSLLTHTQPEFQRCGPSFEWIELD